MSQEAAKPRIDHLLLPFLNAGSEAESRAILEQLIVEHAQPLVRDIVSFKLRASASRWGFNRDGQEVEDISNEVIVRLVSTLHECRSCPEEKPIASLRGYVATMAYNASDEYLRHKYPRRFSLKNKIKYILTHQPALAQWEGENRGVLCGLAAWEGVREARTGARRLLDGRGELDAVLRKEFAGRPLGQVNLATLVPAVLRFAGAPVEIDELVTVMADLLGVRDAPPQAGPEDESPGDPRRLSFDPREALDNAFDHRARLKRVWDEIRQLPPRQRLALLLNLRDEHGGAAITLLPMLRLASLQQIADSLEMSPGDLAAIWNDLPLEDSAIGDRLGLTRQQVANLRKCARERLARRLARAGAEDFSSGA